MAELSTASHGALLAVLYLAGPVLGVILVVGVVVGVFLAVTQVNEPTLSFVPKFLATGAVLVLLGPWLVQRLEVFTISIFSDLARIAQ